ncbi:MAG: TauD/TfdA family dioxygenase [Flavobacteriales bacterium]|nr:TauD/TfdA family dioxygenase [Flavobacteriales bacterium]
MEFFRELEIKDNSQPDNFKELLESTKVLVLRKKPSKHDGNYYQALAQTAGYLTMFEENHISGELKRSWLEIRYVPEKSEETYKNSNHFQPLHTDYAYFSIAVEISFFYCIEQAEIGGSTYFIDTERVAQILKLVDPVLFQEVIGTPIRYSRGTDEFSFNEDMILKPTQTGGYEMTWNYFRVMRNNPDSMALAEKFKLFLETHVERCGEFVSIKLQPGDAVFFRDREVLHGRNSFIGNRHLNKGGIILNDIERKTEILNSYLKRLNG